MNSNSNQPGSEKLSINGIQRLLTLQEAHEALGGSVPVKTLRAEIKAGNLKAVRARPSANSRFLVTACAVNEWLEAAEDRVAIRR